MTTTLPRRRSTAALLTVLAACLALAPAAPAKPLAYITQSEDGNGPPNNRVSVVDTATMAEVGSVTVAHDPDGVALSPDCGTIAAPTARSSTRCSSSSRTAPSPR